MLNGAIQHEYACRSSAKSQCNTCERKNMSFCPLQSGELIALPRFVGICLRFSNRTHARWMTFTVKLPKLYVVHLFEPAFPPLPHDGPPGDQRGA